MTLSALKNEDVEVFTQTAMNQVSPRTVEATLNSLVADTMKAIVNTQGVHWNIEGPLFYSVHKLTESQYEEMFEAVDTLAERVRARGHRTVQNFDQVASMGSVPDIASTATAEEQIDQLAGIHEALVKKLKAAVREMEVVGDQATADLLTDRVAAHQEHIWMLRATLS